MKNKIYLKNNKHKILFKEFTDCIDDLDEPEPKSYKRKCISVFDHWLTEDEYRDSIVSFCDVVRRENPENENMGNDFLKYYVSECKFITFYTYLYLNYKLIFYDDDKKEFYKFTSLESYLKTCEESIRKINSKDRFVDIYIPKFDCVIKGSYDFTNILYYTDDKYFLSIKQYVSQASLHILE